MRKSQLAINAVSTRHADLEEALSAYSAAGFRNAEFPMPHLKGYMQEGHTLADLLRLLDQYRMRCIGGFECVLECFSPAAQRRRNHALIAANARLLADLGAGAMVVGTDGPGEGSSVKITLNSPQNLLKRSGVWFVLRGRLLTRAGSPLQGWWGNREKRLKRISTWRSESVALLNMSRESPMQVSSSPLIQIPTHRSTTSPNTGLRPISWISYLY